MRLASCSPLGAIANRIACPRLILPQQLLRAPKADDPVHAPVQSLVAHLDAVELPLEARDDSVDGRVVGLALGLGEDGEEHRAVERAVLLGHLREARLPPPEHLDAELDESGEGRGARGEGRGARGVRRGSEGGAASGESRAGHGQGRS